MSNKKLTIDRLSGCCGAVVYPDSDIKKEKEMETREEYKQGCRETDIRTLVSGDAVDLLISRITNFVNEKQSNDFKNLMVDFIVENNLVDDEELK